MAFSKPMKRLPGSLRPRAFRLIAGGLLPLLAVAGVAEQVCWCAEDAHHGTGAAEHDGAAHDGAAEVRQKQQTAAPEGDQHRDESGHESCACDRADTVLCELSQPVRPDPNVPDSLCNPPAAVPVARPRLGVRGPARARAARSEHPPPLFLRYCSWLC